MYLQKKIAEISEEKESFQQQLEDIANEFEEKMKQIEEEKRQRNKYSFMYSLSNNKGKH